MGQSLCCFRHSKTKQHNVSKNRREDKRKLLKADESTKTLEEYLKNSPAVNPRVQPRKRVYPSLSSPDQFHTPRMSFSSSKVDDEAQRCGKGKKKVTFRLPEEDDMILFYSPAFDCINES